MKTKFNATKRIIAGVLAVSLCATAIPTAVFAEDTPGDTVATTDTPEMSYNDMLALLDTIATCYTQPYVKSYIKYVYSSCK